MDCVMGISIVAIVIIRVDIDANHRRPLSEDNNVLFRDDSMRIDFSRNHKNKRYAAVKVPGRADARRPGCRMLRERYALHLPLKGISLERR